MKLTLILVSLAAGLAGCSSSKSLAYNFESTNITDSITQTLKKYETLHGGNYLKTKWFALVRENRDGYDLIINENTRAKNFPFTSLIRKTNRFINVGNRLQIPVIFEIDFLSEDFKKITRGTVFLGGYYFKVVRENNEYKVSETGILF